MLWAFYKRQFRQQKEEKLNLLNIDRYLSDFNAMVILMTGENVKFRLLFFEYSGS